MKEEIDLIFSNLKNECITEKQAHQQVLNLSDVMTSVCLHLIIYVDEDNFQRCQSCDEIVD